MFEMKSLPNVAPPTTKNWYHHHHSYRNPIPPAAIYVLLALFLLGLCVSVFILIVIHNAIFFVVLLCISTLVAAFFLWNSRNAAITFFLHSFPDSDLNLATHGQLVKITGGGLKFFVLKLFGLLNSTTNTVFLCTISPCEESGLSWLIAPVGLRTTSIVVSCGNVLLESSYEKVSPCVYTSTTLYEYKEMCSKPLTVRGLCLPRRLTYSERHSTDFYITDIKSDIRALVKGGPDSKITPLIIESILIRTSKRCRGLSSDFRKWLAERKVSSEARSLCLQEGYIKEGSFVSVIGVLHQTNDVLMIVQPHEIVSTGCLWPKLLLPVDIEGLIIGFPKTAIPTAHTIGTHCP